MSYDADEIHVGVNGSLKDALTVVELIPEKSMLYAHGDLARSELPTIAMLRKWLPQHQEWNVFYHHSKGVTQPDDVFHHHHRRAMEKACVWNWRQCVKDLDRGFDVVGINIVDPITRPVLPGRFVAGNFWWATASFLLELPGLPDNATDYNNVQDRCRAEGWIGLSKRRPKMLDYERPELSQWCNL